MSELKFACPVCGQHITCAVSAAGSRMDCPTCFRQIVVPQPPANGGSKFILTAAEASQRPRTGLVPMAAPVHPRKRSLLIFVFGSAAAIALLAAGVVWRGKLYSRREEPKLAPVMKAETQPRHSKPDCHWTTNLTAAKIPDSSVTGSIHGSPFNLTRATVQGGTLNLRQGPKWPPDLGVTVQLYARQAEDLSSRTVVIESSRTNAPKLTLRWKDQQGRAVNRTFRDGYSLRLEFNRATNAILSGRVYLSVSDAESSWLAGTFSAEIRKPQRSKGVAPAVTSD